MDMVRMVTTSEHVYAGRALKAGDEFDCEKQHVILMTVRRCAHVKESTTEAPTYQTRAMTAGKTRRRAK